MPNPLERLPGEVAIVASQTRRCTCGAAAICTRSLENRSSEGVALGTAGEFSCPACNRKFTVSDTRAAIVGAIASIAAAIWLFSRPPSLIWELLLACKIVGSVAVATAIFVLFRTSHRQKIHPICSADSGPGTTESRGPQLVGAQCVHCAKTVVVADEGVLCKRCEAPVHRKCRTAHRDAAHAAPGSYRSSSRG